MLCLRRGFTPAGAGMRMIKALLSVRSGLVMAIGVVVGGLSQAGDLDDVTAASDSLQAVVREALAEEDGGLLASIFTEDGAVISPDGRVVRGRLTLRASATLLFMTMGGGEIEIKRSAISLIDSTAYETGRFVFTRTGDESGDIWRGSYAAIWQREAGRWKVHRAIGLR